MAGTIYIANASGHDYSSAEGFGTSMVPLTKGRVNIFNTDRLQAEMRRKLHAFDEGEDWLLLSGNMVINIIAYSVLAQQVTHHVPVLIFDVVQRKYYPRDIVCGAPAKTGGSSE